MAFMFKPTRLDRMSAKRQARCDDDALERAVNRAVDARDKGRCRCCGRRGRLDATSVLDRLHRHHVIYRSRQGAESASNKVTLCALCHAAEHAKQLWIVGTDANGPLRFEVLEAAVVALFGTRELPKHVSIVLPEKAS
jgi:hypothetical protein